MFYLQKKFQLTVDHVLTKCVHPYQNKYIYIFISEEEGVAGGGGAGGKRAGGVSKGEKQILNSLNKLIINTLLYTKSFSFSQSIYKPN